MEINGVRQILGPTFNDNPSHFNSWIIVLNLGNIYILLTAYHNWYGGFL